MVELVQTPPLPVITLEEVWRVGGANPDQEIGDLASVVISRSGLAAIVDFSLGEVNVINSSGEWIGNWGRRGRGPGELIMPVAANWAGDTLIVYDIEQSRISLFRNGDPLGDHRIPSELSAAVVASGMIDYVAVVSDGTVLISQPLKPLGDSSQFIVLQAGPESIPDTLVSARVQHVAWEHGTMPHPAGAIPRIAVGPDRWMAVTAGDGSQRVLLSHGVPVRQLCGSASALPLSEEERGRGTAPRGFDDAFHALAAAPEPRDRSSVGRIVVGGNGDVWLDTRRPRAFTRERMFGRPGGAMAIHDARGEAVGTVSVPDNVAVQAVSDSLAIGVEFTEMDEVWIVGYRIQRTLKVSALPASSSRWDS